MAVVPLTTEEDIREDVGDTFAKLANDEGLPCEDGPSAIFWAIEQVVVELRLMRAEMKGWRS